MTWEVVETDKHGEEKILRVTKSKQIAERAVLMRRSALSRRGKLDDYTVCYRRVGQKDARS